MSTVRRVGVGVAAAAGVAVLACAVWVWAELDRPYAGWRGGRVDVDLQAGLSATAMLERLGRAGVLRHPRLVQQWVAIRGGGGRLQAGEYRFERPASPLEVLDRLRRGDVLLHSITIPEGLVLEETARVYAEEGLGPYDRLVRAFRDPTPILDLDAGAPDLEGYLFPETYRFSRGTPAERIARSMVARFREAAGEGFPFRARSVGLGVREAVTLASMIERETGVPSERRRISRVFHNRLERGMKLQCDPTVIYALHRAGRAVTRLSLADLDFDSPWNTYRVSGLPPGPIASPGRASLEAAVEPGEGRELYFVAAPNGGHRFSTTLEAHLEAVAAWRAYSRSSE